jgi:hypothetical protein
MAETPPRPPAQGMESGCLTAEDRALTGIDNHDTRRPDLTKGLIEDAIEVVPIREVAHDDQIAIEQMDRQPFCATRDAAGDWFNRKLAWSPHGVIQIGYPASMNL